MYIKKEAKQLSVKKNWRPSWDKTWMDIAKIFAKRSACKYYKVGAIIVKQNCIVGTGYNGPPKGIEHCEEIGCNKQDHNGNLLPSGSGKCRGSHAEINAIINAPGPKSDLEGATLYCTYRPCLNCSKHLINAGIKKIIFLHDYNGDEYAFDLLKKANIVIEKYEEE